MPQKVKVFISYACKDKNLRERLDSHLSSLKRQDYIDVWHDRDVGAGRDWKREIDVHLNDAQVILLLVSADFLASDYCYGIEMKRALERHELGEARVIPVILRPVYWEGMPFSHLQALPTAARPVTGPGWRNQDEAFADIVRGLRRAIAAHRRKVDWILIKAICDWADGNKGQDKSTRQQLAADNAVRFTLHMLKQGGFVKDSASIPTASSRPNGGSASPAPERGTLLRAYDVHASWVVAVTWEPNGTRIASAMRVPLGSQVTATTQLACTSYARSSVPRSGAGEALPPLGLEEAVGMLALSLTNPPCLSMCNVNRTALSAANC